MGPLFNTAGDAAPPSRKRPVGIGQCSGGTGGNPNSFNWLPIGSNVIWRFQYVYFN